MPVFLGVAGLAAILVIGTGMAAGPASSDLPAIRPVMGAADAPIVIREYADFQCPACGAFARHIEPQIRAAYVDTGIVRFEWHDFAWIGRESRDAANAARCAGDQGRFWEYHDVLYHNQAGENHGAFSKERLKDFGEGLDLEPGAFAACIDGDRHAAAVQRDMGDVRAQGFNATPTFLVGDQRIVGAQPFEVFRAAIEAQLGGS
jgi:protein-disulfide isomerase